MSSFAQVLLPTLDRVQCLFERAAAFGRAVDDRQLMRPWADEEGLAACRELITSGAVVQCASPFILNGNRGSRRLVDQGGRKQSDMTYSTMRFPDGALWMVVAALALGSGAGIVPGQAPALTLPG